jgi:hypothetical protein
MINDSRTEQTIDRWQEGKSILGFIYVFLGIATDEIRVVRLLACVRASRACAFSTGQADDVSRYLEVTKKCT